MSARGARQGGPAAAAAPACRRRGHPAPGQGGQGRRGRPLHRRRRPVHGCVNRLSFFGQQHMLMWLSHRNARNGVFLATNLLTDQNLQRIWKGRKRVQLGGLLSAGPTTQCGSSHLAACLGASAACQGLTIKWIARLSCWGVGRRERAGVADGVGSWADYPVPVDAGVYARMLMDHAKAAAAITAPSPLAPLAVMRAAHSRTLVQARRNASPVTQACAGVVAVCSA